MHVQDIEITLYNGQPLGQLSREELLEVVGVLLTQNQNLERRLDPFRERELDMEVARKFGTRR